ncbi:S46 family peptidase [Ferrimonas balearica]|uniref:S46 family peptidase n=1 Tax=Ferrimonas balearica TaxID=44012 RepID=UPI001F2BF9D0|nr:S46 family peptidase [Ferrimonas balearica]MBY6094344.1 S46 family peptidase [Ferrimonas balearica]
MPTRKLWRALTPLALLTALPLHADEGQWLPHQLLELQDQLEQRRIELPAEQLADLTKPPMNAVVGLGYCTASFVSPKGLVVTNHHCAYGAIQYNSHGEHNYMADGFLAKDMAHELPAGPQERLYITDKVEDVTGQVLNGTAALEDGYQRYQQIEHNRKAVIQACEADPAYRCSVRDFHGGLKYYLLRQLVIRDVRLVYAPPESVGAYGGDIDNFEYPRHSGDFTFLRAYVAKDGSPAAYSEDNVPYQPAGFLSINAEGVRAGDGVLVAGYPGRTSRHKLTEELTFSADWLYPTQAERYQGRIDAIEALSATTPEVAVAYAATKASYANRMKKLNGLLDGFRKTDIPALKASRDNAFVHYLEGKPEAHSLTELRQLVATSQADYQANFYLSNAQSGALLSAASSLYRWAKEQKKPDAERDAGYQERDRKLFAARLDRLERRFDARMDRILWQQDIDAYQAQDQRDPVLDAELAKLDLDTLYVKTTLGDKDQRRAWMEKSAAEFEQSSDPLIRMAVALYPGNDERRKARKAHLGELAKARPVLMQAMLDWYQSLDRPVYPDANGTLRISIGHVDGYQAADALYKQPFTRLEGIREKHTGEAPFAAPAKVLAAIDERRFGDYARTDLTAPKQEAWYCGFLPCAQADAQPFGSVPVNFLSSADTTGGNSGSPVMNGRGELVGLNFDSTYESITKDWYFNPAITRAVHVDIRYVLWMMSEVDNADWLLQELTLVK